MKQRITDYTFDVATKTITFVTPYFALGYPVAEKVFLIKNATTRQVIYQVDDHSYGTLVNDEFGDMANLIFTADTTGMTNDDDILIIYEHDPLFENIDPKPIQQIEIDGIPKQSWEDFIHGLPVNNNGGHVFALSGYTAREVNIWTTGEGNSQVITFFETATNISVQTAENEFVYFMIEAGGYTNFQFNITTTVGSGGIGDTRQIKIPFIDVETGKIFLDESDAYTGEKKLFKVNVTGMIVIWINPTGGNLPVGTVTTCSFIGNGVDLGPKTIYREQIQDGFITGVAAQSALGNNILLASAGTTSIDTLNPSSQSESYRSFYCQIVGGAGIASGQVIFEGSNDNVTFTPIAVYDEALVTGVPIVAAFSIAASTNRFFAGKTSYRHVRCRISTVFAGGTIRAYTKFSKLDYVPRINTIAQAPAANLNATVTGTVATTMAAAATTTPAKAEDAAHASGDVGIPDLGVRYEALASPTSAAGDYGFKQVDELGKTVVKPFAPSVNDITGVTANKTDTADTAIFAAQGGIIRSFITSVTVTNENATATAVVIKDGSTVLWRGFVKANDQIFVHFPTPLRGSANTAINVANITTAASTYFTLTGYKAV